MPGLIGSASLAASEAILNSGGKGAKAQAKLFADNRGSAWPQSLLGTVGSHTLIVEIPRFAQLW